MNDDQSNEIEALESIYGGDFRVPSPGTWDILVKATSDAEENHVSARLRFILGRQYPAKPPIKIEVRHTRGIPDALVAGLESSLVEQGLARHTPGAMIIFDLITVAQDWLLLHNERPMSLQERAEQRALDEAAAGQRKAAEDVRRAEEAAREAEEGARKAAAEEERRQRAALEWQTQRKDKKRRYE